MTSSVELLDAEAEEAIKAVGIPPCPAVLTQVIREIRNDEPDFGRIGKLIGDDVALAAAMLKTVNSPFYGLSTPATSVRKALTVLGLETASRLVTRLLLSQAFLVSANPVMERFWESSSRIAELSARIARSLKAADADMAHTFGLFRDCGMAVLLRRFKDYAGIIDGTAIGATQRLTQVENDRYRTNHAHVGALLARSWLLPKPLCLAVLHHHDLDALTGTHAGVDRESIQLIAVAALAEKVYVMVAGEVPSREMELAAPLAALRLGVDHDRLLEFADFAEAN